MSRLNILLTSGGTISEIDDVRHIGNFSKGGTGANMAEEFLSEGNKVHYVRGNNAHIPFVRGLKLDPDRTFKSEVERIEEQYNLYQSYRKHLLVYDGRTFEKYSNSVKDILTREKIDVVILAAAVGDYSAQKVDGKICSDLDELNISLKRNEKIISKIKEWNPSVYQVGFKLLFDVSDKELISVAHRHLVRDNSDLVVANSLNRNYVSTFLVDLDGLAARVQRKNLARLIVKRVERYRKHRSSLGSV